MIQKRKVKVTSKEIRHVFHHHVPPWAHGSLSSLPNNPRQQLELWKGHSGMLQHLHAWLWCTLSQDGLHWLPVDLCFSEAGATAASVFPRPPTHTHTQTHNVQSHYIIKMYHLTAVSHASILFQYFFIPCNPCWSYALRRFFFLIFLFLTTEHISASINVSHPFHSSLPLQTHFLLFILTG